MQIIKQIVFIHLLYLLCIFVSFDSNQSIGDKPQKDSEKRTEILGASKIWRKNKRCAQFIKKIPENNNYQDHIIN